MVAMAATLHFPLSAQLVAVVAEAVQVVVLVLLVLMVVLVVAVELDILVVEVPQVVQEFLAKVTMAQLLFMLLVEVAAAPVQLEQPCEQMLVAKEAQVFAQ
jgi:hypothetical protein